MTSRVVFHNKDGSRVAEIDCTCTRTWVLNGMGQASIQIPLNDSKLTLDNTNFGQFVHIEHPRVGAWGGKIMPPYTEHDADGYAEIRAFTGEMMLKQRRIVNQSFTGTAGDIFYQVVNAANAVEDTRIRINAVESAGVSWTEVVDYSNAYDVLVSIARKSNQYWSIEPALDQGGLLIFNASWHERRGKDWPASIRIEQGTHTEVARGAGLSVQGDLTNDVLVYGNSGSQGSKIFAPSIDTAARSEWGLIQTTIGLSGDSDQASLTAAALSLVRQYAQPIFQPRFVLLDVPCGASGQKAFDFSNLGDSMIYRRFVGRYAGDYRVFITTREFDERSGKLALTVAAQRA